MSPFALAHEIAAEHLAYCASQGLTPAQAVAMMTGRPVRHLTREEAESRLAEAWLRLDTGRAACA